MFELKGQPFEEKTQSPTFEEYSKAYDRYQDFLVNDPTSDPQRPHPIGQFVKDLDKFLGDAGCGENQGGGKFLALPFCLVLPLTMFQGHLSSNRHA